MENDLQRPTEARVIAVFQDRGAADEAAGRLIEVGFDRGEISVAMRGESGTEKGLEEEATSAEHGGRIGASAGAALGGVAGVLAQLTGLAAVPGIGPLLVAGPLAAALTGALLGGSVGGFAGALVGLGLSLAEAERYEDQVKSGNIVMIVRCDGQCEQARQILVAAGGTNVAIYERNA